MEIINYFVSVLVFYDLHALASNSASATLFNDLEDKPAQPQGRIINGFEANTADALSQVSIRRSFYDSFFFGAGHICGGALISLSVVISAAHCFVDLQSADKHYNPAEDFIVVMGILDRSARNNNTVVRTIDRIVYKSPQFNVSSYKDDLALLFLHESVPALHPTAVPIAINRATMVAGTMCQATGWGKDENNVNPILLRRINVPILSDQVCKNETKFESEILDGMICAGYMQGERDTCTGDSGGPLICNNLLTGIISWSEKCAQPGLPGVYADLAYYSPWIEAQLNTEN